MEAVRLDQLAVPVSASIKEWTTLRIKPRHRWVPTAIRDIPTSGIERDDKVHVTACTIPLTGGASFGGGILAAWDFPPKGHLAPAVSDTWRLSTAEWIDAEATSATIRRRPSWLPPGRT